MNARRRRRRYIEGRQDISAFVRVAAPGLNATATTTLQQYVEQEQAFADAGEGEAQVSLWQRPPSCTLRRWQSPGLVYAAAEGRFLHCLLLFGLQKRKIEEEGTKAAQKERGMHEKKGGEAEYVCCTHMVM